VYTEETLAEGAPFEFCSRSWFTPRIVNGGEGLIDLVEECGCGL
jgi:hypothetical protein